MGLPPTTPEEQKIASDIRTATLQVLLKKGDKQATIIENDNAINNRPNEG